MAAALPEDLGVEVFYRTDDDMREVIKDWLARLGCTYAELEEMWRTGDYETYLHRVAWIEIGRLGHLLDG